MKPIRDYSENFSALIIEDSQGDFVLIEDYLLEKFKKINIIHCLDYATSINYLHNAIVKPSVILLDLDLPDLGGIELINGIISNSSQVPIIILTDYSDVAMSRSSLEAGIYDFLLKDQLNPDILYRTIIFTLNRSSFVNQIEFEKLNYENLFNFNPQPTWLLELVTFKVLYANIAAQNKYGYTLEDFQKMSFLQLHSKEEEHQVLDKFSSKKEEFSSSYFKHFLSNGKEIKVDIHFREIQNTENGGVIVQSNDVSETLQYINTIEVQNKKLRNIAWTQSHVVRAPLSRVLGILNMIELQQDDLQEVMFWLKQLRVSTNELDDIIKNIIKETNQIEQE